MKKPFLQIFVSVNIMTVLRQWKKFIYLVTTAQVSITDYVLVV